MGEHITFVGLDVHKATIAVCVAEAGRDGEVRFVGEVPNDPAALDKLVAGPGRGAGTPLRLRGRPVRLRRVSAPPRPGPRLRRGRAEPHPAQAWRADQD